jgi:hypothetical protein
MPLTVIGAGLNRTGTLSLKLALEELGFGPCHHMFELIANPSQGPIWEQVFDGGRIDWDKVYGTYRSAVDAPTCYFYRELSAAYPEAKVILTVREPESWWKSARATTASEANLARFANSPLAGFFSKAVARLLERGIQPDAPADRDAAVSWFKQHTENVRRAIAPGRLLIFEVSEGWEPLCRFLEVPVPLEPFPRTNSTQEFRSEIA